MSEQSLAPDDPAPIPSVAALRQQRDVLSAMTTILLENAHENEIELLRNIAELLTREFADSVLIDLQLNGILHRKVAMAKKAASRSVIASAAESDPNSAGLLVKVSDTNSVGLECYLEDMSALGIDPHGNWLADALSASSIVVLPLSTEQENYGVLTLIRSDGRDSFTDSDAEMASEIGQHIALAIKTDRTVRRHVEIARALQQGLLPRDLPNLPYLEIGTGYLAASADMPVGGDFYDVFPSGSGWGLVLGDVCGKGEQAAAVTAGVRNAVRVLGLTEPRPDEMLNQVNRFLLAQRDTERFVTAVVARLRWHGQLVRASISTAGHPAALILRRNGAVAAAASGGRPLGLLPEVRPSLSRVKLHVGETLVMYSDGIVEARNAVKQTFGDQRLSDKLASLAGQSAQDIATELVTQVANFSVGQCRDDVSVLAVRILPR